MRPFLLVSVLILAAIPLFSFPENSEAREVLREIITAPANDSLAAESIIIDQFTDGSRVSFSVKQQADSFYLLFVNESGGRFPLYSKGTYIIKRDMSDGKFVQIKVFLKNHTECYARIFPMDERAVMDIYLYGKQIYQGINLPFSFAEALTESFGEVIAASAGVVDWSLVFPSVSHYLFSEKASLVSEIRYLLPELGDVDDGAIDADGDYVFIEDLSLQPEGYYGLNCSGFVKWVADGIYYAETSEYMSIEDLKNKHLSARGNRWSLRHEDERDPYFGLDWTRNIAVEITEAKNGRIAGYKSADVDNVPWLTYVNDVGYPIEELKLLMYYLAVREPEYIYLASINVSWGTEPILQQHIHTAVLIPLLNDKQEYKDIIFERNFESNAESLAEDYPDSFVHLTRIKVSPGYKLPELVKKPSLAPGSFFRR